MRFGRGGWNWYDIIIVGLAAVIVCPDRVLDWIGERTLARIGTARWCEHCGAPFAPPEQTGTEIFAALTGN